MATWANFAHDRFDKLGTEKYKDAFKNIKLAKNDLVALQAHYQAPDYDITATQLARRIGFRAHEIANLTYGVLSQKILKCLNIRVKDSDNLFVLVKLYFHPQTKEWHWVLRPQVVNALKELGWVEESQPVNELEDIKLHKSTYSSLEKTEREAIVQSRIGQGKFRMSLIHYWKGCSVTGCEQIDILKASHIKPWSRSSNPERLNVYNGLLLLPNLDACFDSGFISFDDDGKILLSSNLNKSTKTLLGLTSNMKLRWVDEKHKKFLQHHRKTYFKP